MLKRLSFAQKCERSFGGNPPKIYFGKGRAEGTTKIAHTQIFEQKNEVNRILFYIEGTIMDLGACT